MPPPHIAAALGTTEDTVEISFPYEYRLATETIEGDTVLAWLSTRADSTWPAEDEPRGSTPFELCYCATHTPQYANDAHVVIDP